MNPTTNSVETQFSGCTLGNVCECRFFSTLMALLSIGCLRASARGMLRMYWLRAGLTPCGRSRALSRSEA
jgi:hypothetical protein